jgi:hypothetical protein
VSHFYGTLKGTRGQATRCGSKSSGITVQAASWAGAVEVRMWHDEETGRDYFSVEQFQWHGRGARRDIAHGYVGEAVQGETLTPRPPENLRTGRGEEQP